MIFECVTLFWVKVSNKRLSHRTISAKADYACAFQHTAIKGKHKFWFCVDFNLKHNLMVYSERNHLRQLFLLIDMGRWLNNKCHFCVNTHLRVKVCNPDQNIQTFKPRHLFNLWEQFTEHFVRMNNSFKLWFINKHIKRLFFFFLIWISKLFSLTDLSSLAALFHLCNSKILFNPVKFELWLLDSSVKAKCSLLKNQVKIRTISTIKRKKQRSI